MRERECPQHIRLDNGMLLWIREWNTGKDIVADDGIFNPASLRANNFRPLVPDDLGMTEAACKAYPPARELFAPAAVDVSADEMSRVENIEQNLDTQPKWKFGDYRDFYDRDVRLLLAILRRHLEGKASDRASFVESFTDAGGCEAEGKEI